MHDRGEQRTVQAAIVKKKKTPSWCHDRQDESGRCIGTDMTKTIDASVDLHNVNPTCRNVCFHVATSMAIAEYCTCSTSALLCAHASKAYVHTLPLLPYQKKTRSSFDHGPSTLQCKLEISFHWFIRPLGQNNIFRFLYAHGPFFVECCRHALSNCVDIFFRWLTV